MKTDKEREERIKNTLKVGLTGYVIKSGEITKKDAWNIIEEQFDERLRKLLSIYRQQARQEALDEAIEKIKKEINYIRKFYKKENTDHFLLDFAILRFRKFLSTLQGLKTSI